jgi:hypothetical protein
MPLADIFYFLLLRQRRLVCELIGSHQGAFVLHKIQGGNEK